MSHISRALTNRWGDLTCNYLERGASTTNASSYNFLNAADTATGTGIIVVGFVTSGTVQEISSVTFDGVSMTSVATTGAQNIHASLWSIDASNLTAGGDLSVTVSGSVNNCGYATWEILGQPVLFDVFHTDTSDPLGLAGVNIAYEGNVGIIIAGGTAGTSFTWSGSSNLSITEDFDAVIEGTVLYTGGHYSVQFSDWGNNGIDVDASGVLAGGGIAAAAWTHKHSFST